jgi:acyl carrier protein
MDIPALNRLVEATWCAVLVVDQANDEDDFFELGGDSLRAVELIERVELASGRTFPVETLFIEGTLGAVKGSLAAEASR